MINCSSCSCNGKRESPFVMSYGQSTNSGNFGACGTASGETDPSQRRKRKKQISANVSGTRYEVVRQTVLKLGYSISRDDDFRNCYLIWSDVVISNERFSELLPYQRVNHFPAMGEICRKDCLSRNMNKMKSVEPTEFDIFPRTWVFPHEFKLFQSYIQKLKQEHRKSTFILKPANGAMGNGIRLVRHPESLTPSDNTIIQEYINEPFLMDGYKCDMRIYVLVTKCLPLRIFVFNDGLLRMGTEAYESATDNNCSSLFMHLTNYSVNKHNDKYEKGSNDSSGSKRSLRFLMNYLRREGHDIQALWRRITDVIIKTLLVAVPHVYHAYRMSRPGQPPGARSVCFEILGFDILLDKDLRPWLLEVNRSPSFGTDEAIDQEIKSSLLEDAFRLLNIKASDKRRNMNAQKRESQRRLFGGPAPVMEYKGDMKLMQRQKLNSRKKELLRRMLVRIRKDAAEEEYENSNCGRYRRIFPADDCFTMANYVNFLKESLNIFANGTHNSLRRDFDLIYSKNLKEEEIIDMLAKCEEDDEQLEKSGIKQMNGRTPRLPQICQPLQSMPSASSGNRRSRSCSSFYDSTSEEDEDFEDEEGETYEAQEADSRQPALGSTRPGHYLMTGASLQATRRPPSSEKRRMSSERMPGGKGVLSYRAPVRNLPPTGRSLKSRPSSTTPPRLSAILGASSIDDDKAAEEVAARGVLRGLREHRIRFPGKTAEEADKLLHKIYDNWNYHKPRVANYWIMTLDSQKRKKVIDIVLSNVHALVLRHYKVRDIEGIRLYRLIKRVCNRLQWSNGQGLWQTFEAPGSWETILSKSPETIPISEMSCCRRVVELCKDCLLIVYKYASEQQRPGALLSSMDPLEREDSSHSLRNSSLRRTFASSDRSVMPCHRDPAARISVS